MKLSYKVDFWQNLYIWALRCGPRILAHWIAAKARNVHHDDGGAWCWPCEARDRYKRDSHNHTTSPMARIYCDKCGLDKSDWRKWCSNRVEKVNNKPQPKPRHVSVGWDE